MWLFSFVFKTKQKKLKTKQKAHILSKNTK